MGARAVVGWNGTRRLGASAFAVMLTLVVAVSAHATLSAFADQRAQAARTGPPAGGYEAQDHFPGSALEYADPPRAAPAIPDGATGTIALPAVPASARVPGPDPSLRPAAPFVTTHVNATDRGRALQCLTDAVYYEAAREPDAGQRAVAQVVLNRVRHPAFPATVCGVVFQGSDHGACQFSFACDGAMARRVPFGAAWLRAERVAAAALGGYVARDVGLATHYHTYAVTPAWNRDLVMTAAIGAHFFHRWQGYWGTPAAFHQPYRGGEPVPGPHPPLAVPALPLTTALPTTGPTTSTTAIRAAYAQSGTALAAAPPPAALPGDSQILDKWKDSGKPLR